MFSFLHLHPPWHRLCSRLRATSQASQRTKSQRQRCTPTSTVTPPAVARYPLALALPIPNPIPNPSLPIPAASDPLPFPLGFISSEAARPRHQWRSRALPRRSSPHPPPPASAASTRCFSPPHAAARRGASAAPLAGSAQVDAVACSSLILLGMACRLIELFRSVPLQRLPPRRMCSPPRRSRNRSTSPTRSGFTSGNFACTSSFCLPVLFLDSFNGLRTFSSSHHWRSFGFQSVIWHMLTAFDAALLH